LFFNKIQKKIKSITSKSLVAEIEKNINFNIRKKKIDKSIIELKNFSFKKKSKIALVVSGGPSLRKNNFIPTIKKYKKKIIIICADGSLFYLLENNIIPDLVVTLDPHKTRIVRWFGDKKLTNKNLKKDNYFRRQDIDKKLNKEILINKKILKLTEKFGKYLNIAICTSSSKRVVDRLKEIKSNLYWWHPYLDDPKKINSLTKKIYKKKKLPILNSFGNVGSACWVFAETVLQCKKILLIGMDCSYYLDTPIKSTQYYDVLLKSFGKKNIEKFYLKIKNPFIKKYFYTDHIYYWYKNLLLAAIKSSKSKTFNCSNAGILFEKPIIVAKLKPFLEKNVN